MTEQQKEYIEQHVDLIKHDEWDEFFKKAPEGTGGVLYAAGIDFITSLKKVPQYAFFRCSSLTGNLIIPDSVTEIGDSAFYGCSGFTGDLVIPDSVIEIGWCAFEGCSGFTGNLVIPDSITEIGDGVFFGCSGFTKIIIPKSVISIDKEAFSDCNNIEIDYGGTVDNWKQLIGDDDRVFYNTTYTCNCIDGVVKKSR